MYNLIIYTGCPVLFIFILNAFPGNTNNSCMDQQVSELTHTHTLYILLTKL